MTPTKQQLFWKSHLEALEGFEGTAAEYARLHDLEVKKLYVYKSWWRDHGSKVERTGGGFVRVTATTQAQYGPGVQVRPAGTAGQTLSHLALWPVGMTRLINTSFAERLPRFTPYC